MLQSKATIVEVRIIEQAHTTPITCLAYSHRLSIVATAAPDGACHVWDFQVSRYEPLLTSRYTTASLSPPPTSGEAKPPTNSTLRRLSRRDLGNVGRDTEDFHVDVPLHNCGATYDVDRVRVGIGSPGHFGLAVGVPDWE